ncbi:MAG: Ppx/GppA family phosphatase [Desulfarculus sp.]|nr:Ppx/GppA family phosphatase [Desulfarculus sp.]
MTDNLVIRAAAMDLGSNTLRLLVADVEDGRWRAVGRGLATPRLGRGLNPGGKLHPEAKQAAFREAKAFAETARGLGASRVTLAATQACRLAADGPALVAELARELSLDRARVLSGQEEARLSRLGTLSRLTGPATGALLADVGGGSSEVVDLGDDTVPPLSLPLGAVSLGEAYLRSDPPAPAELKALTRAVEEALSPLAGRTCRRLVASAGTAATLGSLVLGLTDYQPEAINNLEVTATRLEGEMDRLAGLPLAVRRGLKGLEAARADIIIPGLAILRGLLAVLSLDRLTVMDAGLLEGILLDDLAHIGA